MKIIHHPAELRGAADYGWLKARYSFSFANYFNPNNIQFGALRVLNDDIVAPAMGFGTHPHDNMEIITIPLAGAVAHRDSMGNQGSVAAGEIQVMSAGTGITHSEMNASKTTALKLLQIWIFPQINQVEPRYQQMAYQLTDNQFTTVVSPHDKPMRDTLWIYQQAYISLGNFSENTTYQVKIQNPGVYLFVIQGTVAIGNLLLQARDAVAISEVTSIELIIDSFAQILLLEVPL